MADAVAVGHADSDIAGGGLYTAKKSASGISLLAVDAGDSEAGFADVAVKPGEYRAIYDCSGGLSQNGRRLKAAGRQYFRHPVFFRRTAESQLKELSAEQLALLRRPFHPLPNQANLWKLTWQGGILLLWLMVVCAMLLLLMQRAMFVFGLVRQSKEAGDEMRDTLEDCRKQ